MTKHLIWVEDPDRRDEVVAAAEQLGAPVIETYGARGVMPLGHPMRIGFPPHSPAVGALWDEADVVHAFGAQLDGMNTQNFLQPQPPRLIAVACEPGPNYTVDEVVETVSETGEAWADLGAVRIAACRDLDARALRFLDALSFALPDDATVVCDMCIPGYWTAGFPPLPRTAAPALPRRLGHARLRLPCRDRRRPRRPRPDRRPLRRRRLPVRLRRARDGRPGGDPVDHRHRR